MRAREAELQREYRDRPRLHAVDDSSSHLSG